MSAFAAAGSQTQDEKNNKKSVSRANNNNKNFDLKKDCLLTKMKKQQLRVIFSCLIVAVGHYGAVDGSSNAAHCNVEIREKFCLNDEDCLTCTIGPKCRVPGYRRAPNQDQGNLLLRGKKYFWLSQIILFFDRFLIVDTNVTEWTLIRSFGRRQVDKETQER